MTCAICGEEHPGRPCNWENFSWCLSTLNLKRVELARELGIAPPTISRWQNDAPRYAMAYLHERLKRQQAAERLTDDGYMCATLAQTIESVFNPTEPVPPGGSIKICGVRHVTRQSGS